MKAKADINLIQNSREKYHVVFFPYPSFFFLCLYPKIVFAEGAWIFLSVLLMKCPFILYVIFWLFRILFNILALSQAFLFKWNSFLGASLEPISTPQSSNNRSLENCSCCVNLDFSLTSECSFCACLSNFLFLLFPRPKEVAWSDRCPI